MRARLVLISVASLLVASCTAPIAPVDSRHRVTLLHTSDIHSHVWPERVRVSSFEGGLGLGTPGVLEEVGGMARLATLLGAQRQQAPSALWLDSGDALEGTEIFERFRGSPEIQLLGAMGMAAMALGNHELSLSARELAERAVEARFPLLTANLTASSGPLVGRLAPSALLTAEGVRLGVIGVSSSSSPPDLDEPGNPWQLEVATDAAAAVQAALDELGPRADLLIVLSHLGLDGDRSLVRDTTGIDLVLGGHQHLVTEEPEWARDCGSSTLRDMRGCVSRDVPIVHSGAYGRWLSRIDLQLRVGAEGLEVEALQLLRFAVNGDVPEDARVLELLEPLLPEAEAPVGFAPARLSRETAGGGDSALGNLVADAVRYAVSADVVLLNRSALRADIEFGPILRSDLHQVFPFAEPWHVGLVPSDALERGLSRAARRSASRGCSSALEQSGLAWHVDCEACAAACGRARLVDGRLLEESALLEVALPDYLLRPGADFDELSAFTNLFDVDVPAALTRSFELKPRGGSDACATELAQLSASRCRAAFGVGGCPVSVSRARAICSALPRVEGEPDGRTRMGQ